ncbi:MAG: MFS transporter [Proteobacteria bacterium]|nr:MFS transporter [Pseudomonadota bacterium]
MLFLLTAAYVFAHVDRNLMSILLEPVKEELGVSDTLMGLLVGFSFAIFYTTAGIPVARWADRGTRRNIVALALVVWSGMTALSGMARNFWQLALARVGVGMGEAGCSPPAHSLISDYFPPASRGRALALFSAGIHIGGLFGWLAGGWLEYSLGWRSAFVIIGLPGILLGLLIRMTLREPERGRLDPGKSETEPAPFWDAVGLLWRQRSYVHLQIGGALHAFSAIGMGVWIAPFFTRIHGMELYEIGSWMGPLGGTCGFVGAFLGGWLSDRLSPRDARWYLWLPTITALGAIPFTVAFLFAPTPLWAFLFYVPHHILGSTFNGPTYAMTQAVVTQRTRALAVAAHLLVVNLLGMGLGPLLVGALNDFLRPEYGDIAIRYTMLVAALTNLTACVFYLWGARTVREEIARIAPA